jgi:hypothetical protein
LDHPTIVVLIEALGVPPSGDFAVQISLSGATEKITLSREDKKGFIFYPYSP